MITLALREWVKSLYTPNSGQVKDEALRIADRIDAEHESACAEAYGNGVESVGLPDMTAYVKLPVDADGQTIHLGDVMEERDGHTFEVASLMAFGGWDNWLVLSDPRNFSSFREPHDIHHVRPDSWERIIRDALRADRTDAYAVSTSMLCELVERCKKLAGESR